MAVNKRLLFLNTVVSYARTALSVGLSLFTTRWVLNCLGTQDYGFYVLVGGIVGFLMFINTALSASVQRFLSYAMDQGGYEIRAWFSTSFYIHLICAVLVIVFAFPLYWVSFKFFFSIPETRLLACRFVFWISVFAGVISIISVPYNAMVVAKQRIFEMTIFQMIYLIGIFLLAYGLFFMTGDLLIRYALGVFIIQVIISSLQILRCYILFHEARIMPVSSCSGRWKSILTFSGWSLLDVIAFLLRNQTIQVLFNRFATSALNASYSIANQLSAQTGVLSGAVTSALSPGIISQYGIGDKRGANLWGLRACKISVFLSLLVFVPLIVECKYVLKIWLINPPDWAYEFVCVMMIAYLVMQTVSGCVILIKAQGDIAQFECCIAGTYFIAVLIAIGIPLCGYKIHLAVYGVLISSVLYVVCAVFQAYKKTCFAWRNWLFRVIAMGGITLSFSVCVSLFLRDNMKESLVRLLSIIFCGGLTAFVFSFFMVAESFERDLVINKIRKIIFRGMK